MEKWLEDSPEEKNAKERLTTWVVQQVRKATPEGTTLQPFGSEVTGLAMSSSDTDLGLHVPSIHDRPLRTIGFAQKVKKLLLQIQDSLPDGHDFSVLYQKSRFFPLVRCVFSRSQYEVQIVSAPSSDESNELVRGYLQEFPQLRPLYFVVRVALQARLLHTPSTGGLGSYCLIMMLVKFFRSGQTSRRDNLGHTLIRFLQYWATRNTTDYAFCPDPPAIWKKRDRITAAPKGLDILQRNDPVSNIEYHGT